MGRGSPGCEDEGPLHNSCGLRGRGDCDDVMTPGKGDWSYISSILDWIREASKRGEHVEVKCCPEGYK